MKTLKWVAMIVVFIVISGMLWVTLSRIVQKRGGVSNQPVGESASKFIPEYVSDSVWDLPIEDVTEWINGRLFSATLQGAALINGFPCSAGIVEFTKSGQLSWCTLAEDTTIQENMIPKDTGIRLDEEFNLLTAHFSEDAEIQGYVVNKTTSSGWLRGEQTRYNAMFYPGGRLRSFFSPSNVIIQGIPCKKTVSGFRNGTPISLYENGNLNTCTLSRGVEIDGRSMSAGNMVALSEDGKVTTVNDSLMRSIDLWINEFLGF
jgi:hypothetical protein